MIRTAAILSLCLCILGPAFSAATEKPLPRLLLQDIQPKGIDEQVARSLTDLLELEIERGRLFEVVSQQDLRKLLQVEEQRLLYGLEEGQEERMGAIAKKVNAPYALATSVGRVGSAYVLSLRLLDVEQSKVIRRVNQTLVGEETGLVGSLRAAVLSLTLEEKGVAADISAGLIDDLNIAEKPKTAFFSISPAYEIPVGFQASADDIITFRPTFYHVRLDAEMPVWKWIRLFASISFGTTINAQSLSESNDIMTADAVSGPDAIYIWQASTVTENFSAMRIPFHLGVKFAPATGRFLPFAQVGVGLSYQTYSLTDAYLTIVRERAGGTCPELFSGMSGSNGQDFCFLEADISPESNVSELGLDVTAGAGFEWLLTQHVGVKAEMRYQFTQLFTSSKDLRRKFSSQEQLSDNTIITVGKLFAVHPQFHGLAFSAGLVVYW